VVYRLQSENVKPTARMRAAIIAGFVLLVLAGLGAVMIALTSANADIWTNHTLQVRRAATLLFSAVQDAETGQRGYLLTNDASYLAPFEQAQDLLPRLEAAVGRLVADNPAQEKRLSDLVSLVDRKMTELEHTIDRHKAGDDAAAFAIVKTNAGRDLMTQIRTISGDFDQAELRLLRDRQSSSAWLRMLLIGLIVLSVLFVALLAYFVNAEARRYTQELAKQNSALQREMTDRQRAEAQLRQAQKMEVLGQLTGGIAHDFNNMLAIIVGNLDILLRRLSEQDGRSRIIVENALAGADRAAALTQRLLAFSRLQPLDPKPTDVNKCVSDVSEMLRHSLGERISIETVLGGGVWRAFVDPPQLESAILNLAVNARDTMPDGGKLTIETTNAALDKAYADEHIEVEPGQYVLVAVTDAGSGMPPEVMEKAFEPFFTTKEVGQGTGLGLSQVHGFVKQSHGHIKLYSEPGVGTTVKLYLPRDVSGAPAAVPVRALKPPAIVGRFTILVVEDDPGVPCGSLASWRSRPTMPRSHWKS